MRSTWIGAVVLVAACGGATRGTLVVNAPAPGAAVASATTADANGVRVLANGLAADGERGLFAASPAELAALWSDVGLGGGPPAVDFATHVVVGTNFEDGVCQPEIVAARVDAHGTLVLDEVPTQEMCILLAVRVAKVVAIPRAIVGARFTWRVGPREAYTFDVPPAPARATRGGVNAEAAPRQRGREGPVRIDHPRGTVDLPPPGHLALRTLDDGREVWVAVGARGDVAVVTADAASGRAGVRNPIRWDPKTARFQTEYDVHGRSIQGGAPLETLAFARVAATRIAIGLPAPLPDGPILPRAGAPVLDGAAVPYGDLAAAPFAAIAEGRFGRVDADLIAGLAGPPRLCKLPEGKLRQYLPGCASDAPALTTAPAHARDGIDQLDGPLVVRRRGTGVELVIDTGNGMADWTVEHRLGAPALRGATRAVGELAVGSIARGDTRGAKDGFTPPCIPAEAGGGPDESWTFTATERGRYAFQLDTDHDGVLAVVGDDGRVLACDDDRHGFYRSSAVHVELAVGAKVRVIVDAFGGDAQRYSLTVRAEPALPRGGVLALGEPVSGDTRHAIDDHSDGCYAPAGDHAYTLTVDVAGAYDVRIETPGWSPLLEVTHADGSLVGCHDSTTPLVEHLRLEPGAYTIVVDGDREGVEGPYTLRVDPAAR